MLSPEQRHDLTTLDTAALERHQLERLNRLLDRVLPGNRFYAEKLSGLKRPVESLCELVDWPYTFKEELVAAQAHGDDAPHRTFELARYVRYHQTSGTRGRPLIVLDTAEDWEWWIETWQTIFDSIGITSADRCFMAFSFGPFIGFWSAFDALTHRGCLTIPAGGISTLARLELMRTSRATVVFCTPSYALHLAEVGEQRKLNVGELGIRRIVLAGEPGGSIPAIRQRIETLWRCQCVDHAGASEVGPWGFADLARRGLHVMESEFIAEFLSVETGQSAQDGELAELVLTNLGRLGSPVIRYRTGDLVRPTWNHGLQCRFVLLEGGIVSRADDMLIVRGVNIFPSAIEQILRGFPEVLEYRLTVYKVEQMDQLRVEIEDRLEQPQRVADELLLRLGLKVDVQCVSLGSLPRFEGKGARIIDQRR